MWRNFGIIFFSSGKTKRLLVVHGYRFKSTKTRELYIIFTNLEKSVNDEMNKRSNFTLNRALKL